jgi:hypothetical protein
MPGNITKHSLSGQFSPYFRRKREQEKWAKGKGYSGVSSAEVSF